MKKLFETTHQILTPLAQSLMGLSCLLAGSVVYAGTVTQVPLFLTTTAKPNIMLMVDNSGSMNSDVVVSSSSTYNPTKTYLSGQCKYNTSSKKNKAISNTPTTKYSTTVPSNFLGNSGGKQCFDPNRTYANTIFDTAMLTLLTTAGVSTDNVKKTNYLNWYYTDKLGLLSTVQTRLFIAKEASSALVDSLTDVRLGLATFNGDTGGTLLEAIDDLTDTKKSNLKNRINNLSATSWTPLAETEAGIGRYFTTGYSSNLKLHPDDATKTQSESVSNVFPKNLTDGTGWRTKASGEPGIDTAPIQYSCQKSFAVLITDGQPTQDRDVSSYLQDYDGDCSGTNSSQCLSASPNYDLKTTYFSSVPGNNTTDYLDDVAEALQDIDLRPDLVKTNIGDKNNVTTFTIGFADPDIDPNQPGVNPILRDTAIQGGGEFYFAGNSAELNQSLISAFNIITDQASSSSSVATNSTQFQTDTLLYQGKFDTTDWSGKLLSFKLLTEDVNGNGKLDSGEDTLIVNNKIDAGFIATSPLWNAANELPPPNERHIYSYNPTATTTKGIEFLWPSLNATQKQVLDNANINATTSPILNYLRGDQSNEGKTAGKYRDRQVLLGDIVNSDPLFVGDQDLGYGALAGSEGSTYAQFLTSIASRRPMIYVGANDGMLHGFDAGATTAGGKEIVAYVPNAVISPELVSLTNQNYFHYYFVDGSPQYGDAYFNNAWHTVLVGSMGAGSTTQHNGTSTGTQALPSGTGGKSVFALDVTDPEAFLDPTTGASKVLWEFSSRDDPDLGYTIPFPTIVRMANGQWAAVVSNGYSSSNGKAALFIINVADGSIIKKIEAETLGANGLSSPVTIDIDDDKIIDYVYAGDLKGNLWKFDVSSSDVSKWGVAYKNASSVPLPLFTAVDGNKSNPQPITVKPAVSKATSNGQTGGVMIYFGTGKYFEVDDNVVPTDPQIQTFYAIWDNCDKSSPTTCNAVISSGRNALQEQRILEEGSSGKTTLVGNVVVAGDYRITSNCEVGYGSTQPKTTSSPCTNQTNRRGWYMDLKSPSVGAEGERAVSTPVYRNNRIIFATLIPFTTTCTPGGTSWLMELDQFTGSRLVGTPFDVNNDGKVDGKDNVVYNGSSVGVSSTKSTVGIIKTPAIVSVENGLDAKYASGSSGSLMMVKESAPINGSGFGSSPGKRTSWRQLR